MRSRFVFFAAAAMTGGASAFALVNPFTEHFDSSAALWSSASSFTPLNYIASGGPDGSAYASRSISFAGNNIGDFPILFRGQSNFNSSGNAFVGNWITGGVTQLKFSIRHNMDADVGFFARIAPDPALPGNPGAAIALLSPAVGPNQWTTFTIDINPGTPFIFEGTNFNTVFSAVARVQFGVTIDSGTAHKEGPFTFDIDNVEIVPAPGALALGSFGLALAGRRRRR